MLELLPIQDPVLVFALVALLIVLAPVVMARWRLPGMVGLILSGALLGPHALGVIAYNSSFVLFGTVGLLYLMFGAALEIDGATLKRHWASSVAFGVLTFALPFAVGLGVSTWVLQLSFRASLLLASVFASHTLVAYPIVSRLGLAKHRVVTASVGGTFLSEPLALFALAVVADAPDAALTPFAMVRPALTLLGFGAVAMVTLPRLARWFFRRVAEDGVAEFAFVLAAIFATASLGHLFGIEPIIGAFVAGLALNRVIPHGSALMSRLRFSGEALFVPFFLLSIGMMLDLHPFVGDPRSWIVAALIVLTTVVTKWAAAQLSRVLLRFSADEGRVLFGMSLPHAAGTLATTLIGFKLKLFDAPVVSAVILLILISCIAGPWLVDRFARRLALEAELPDASAAEAPRRVLIALSNPSSAAPLIELAALLRDDVGDEPLFPLSIITDPDSSHAQIALTERMLATVQGQLSEREIPATPLTRIDPNVPSAIGRAAREVRASDVVVGWTPRTEAQELFFGTMVEKLLKATDTAVLVSRLPVPLNGTQRLVLVVPPHAEREPGFAAATLRVGCLAKGLNVPMLAVVAKDGERAVKKRLRSSRVPDPSRWVVYPEWAHVYGTIRETVREGDLVLVFGARPGSLAWAPALASFPRRLAKLTPSADVIVLYPAEPPQELAADLRPVAGNRAVDSPREEAEPTSA